MRIVKRRKITFKKFLEIVQKQIDNEKDIFLKNLEITSRGEKELHCPSRTLYLKNCSFKNIDLRIKASGSVSISNSNFDLLGIDFETEPNPEDIENTLRVTDSKVHNFFIVPGNSLYDCYIDNSTFDYFDFSQIRGEETFHDFSNVSIKKHINMAYAKNPLYILCDENLAHLIRLSNPTVPIGFSINHKKSKPRA